jgi:hypothetical protein
LIYPSDFGNPGLVDPGTTNEGLFMEAKILAASTGAARYTATNTLLTIAVDSTTAFNVDLNRNADPDPPAVGTYNVQLDVALKYRNYDDTVWIMDNVVYTISITVMGTDASDTAAGAAAAVFGRVDSTTAATANSQAGTRAKAPPSLKVAQSAGGASAGDSVTLTLIGVWHQRTCRLLLRLVSTNRNVPRQILFDSVGLIVEVPNDPSRYPSFLVSSIPYGMVSPRLSHSGRTVVFLEKKEKKKVRCCWRILLGGVVAAAYWF